MTKQDYNDLIIFEVTMEMESKGLRRFYLNSAEYNKMLYEKALEKLVEKGN